MRTNKPGHSVVKFSLATATSEDQRSAEDPLGLRHNLARECSRSGRDQLREQMRKSMLALVDGSWVQAVGDGRHEAFFLKCRVGKAVTPQALLEEFEEFDLVTLHVQERVEFKSSFNHMGQAFFEFKNPVARRRAHLCGRMSVAVALHIAAQRGRGYGNQSVLVLGWARRTLTVGQK